MRTSKVLILSVEEARDILAKHFVGKICEDIKRGVDQTAKTFLASAGRTTADEHFRKWVRHSVGKIYEDIKKGVDQTAKTFQVSEYFRECGCDALADLLRKVNPIDTLSLDDAEFAAVETNGGLRFFWSREEVELVEIVDDVSVRPIGDKELFDDVSVCPIEARNFLGDVSVCSIGMVEGYTVNVYKDRDEEFYVKYVKDEQEFFLDGPRWSKEQYTGWATVEKAISAFNVANCLKEIGSHNGEPVEIHCTAAGNFYVRTEINNKVHYLHHGAWRMDRYELFATQGEAYESWGKISPIIPSASQWPRVIGYNTQNFAPIFINKNDHGCYHVYTQLADRVDQSFLTKLCWTNHETGYTTEEEAMEAFNLYQEKASPLRGSEYLQIKIGIDFQDGTYVKMRKYKEGFCIVSCTCFLGEDNKWTVSHPVFHPTPVEAYKKYLAYLEYHLGLGKKEMQKYLMQDIPLYVYIMSLTRPDEVGTNR